MAADARPVMNRRHGLEQNAVLFFGAMPSVGVKTSV